jgi:hypothetical protein
MGTLFSYAIMLVTTILFFIEPILLCSQYRDTLRSYVGEDVFYYSMPPKTVYAQKYQVFRELSVHSVGVSLYGKSGSSCRLRVFGHEGGAIVPIRESNMIEPIFVTKSGIGVETIWVELPTPWRTRNNNFYIVLDSLSEGLFVLADKSRVTTLCSDPTNSEASQFVKTENGEWKKTDSPLLLDVAVEYSKSNDAQMLFSWDSTAFKSVTKELTDNNQVDRYAGLVCGDLNNDGYTDVLSNSRVWVNQKGTGFIDKTSDYSFPSDIVSQMILDVDNDGLSDIVSIVKHDSISTLNISFGNSRNRNTSSLIPLAITESPTSFSIADYDIDGYLDIVVGLYSSQHRPKHILLRNNRNASFTTELLNTGTVFNCAGSVAFDKDKDGDIDIVMADADSRKLVWMKNDGKGSFIALDIDSDVQQLELSDYSSRRSDFRSRGLSTQDINGDGRMDVLQPYNATMQPDMRGEVFIAQVSNSSINTSSELEEMQSGGVWGDYDNDGYVDFITTTSCGCRYADVYKNIENVKFELMTPNLGLEKISGSHEAVWCDIDNDGRLDLIVPHSGSPRLYRQSAQGNNTNHYANIKLESQGKKPVAGSTVTVFSNQRRYVQTVTIGRGLLVQDPSELHFGLGDNNIIDSVVVQWVNTPNQIETFKPLTTNKVTTLTQGSGVVSSTPKDFAEVMYVYPNPFSKIIKIEFDVRNVAEGQITIHDVNGAVIGSLLPKQLLEPKHYRLEWDGVNQVGLTVPSGVYIIRLTLGDKVYSQRIVKAE